MEKIKVPVINVEGIEEILEVNISDTPENLSCSPGETWCPNGILHKCNSEGKWYATGQSC